MDTLAQIRLWTVFESSLVSVNCIIILFLKSSLETPSEKLHVAAVIGKDHLEEKFSYVDHTKLVPEHVMHSTFMLKHWVKPGHYPDDQGSNDCTNENNLLLMDFKKNGFVKKISKKFIRF